MYRDAMRYGGPPGRVSAGVEVGVKIEAEQLAVARCTGPYPHAGWMALGGRHDRLGSRVDHAHRAFEMPGGNGDEGLDRQIELRAKAATEGGGNDAHIFRRDAEDGRNVVAIHVRRLRARLDFDAVANAASKACLRFDIGVLDEARFKLTFNSNVRLSPARFRRRLAPRGRAPARCRGGFGARAVPRRRVRHQL